jgi:outer membrane protein OmpA-like peptidoglycan-associated protein
MLINTTFKLISFLIVFASISIFTGEAQTSKLSSFDASKAPIVQPNLGPFPYFSLIDGYQKGEHQDPKYRANKDAEFDRYEFFDGTQLFTVEGRLSTIEAVGSGASGAEIVKNYEKLITGLGGMTVFDGTGYSSLKHFRLNATDKRHRDPIGNDNMGLFLLRTPDKEIWTEVYVSAFPQKKGRYYLTVVEKAALQGSASLLQAEEMKKELDSKGHVALYINFDFNKSDIKPDAQPVIDEIQKLLNSNPTLNLIVEGHTDNIGTPTYNKQLSEARAKSVVVALTQKGIKADRLKPVGYGQEKPIADNNSEEGKAKNRRVELVRAS